MTTQNISGLLNNAQFVSALHAKARELGFAALRLSEPDTPPHFPQFLEWLARDKCGDLSWIKRNLDLRRHPGSILEGCRAVLCLALSYPGSRWRTPDGLTIARYASSSQDYHTRIKTLCRGLLNLLKAQYPESRARVFVDSGPILERSLACASGLGFIGKNTSLIRPGLGSYLHLAEILTTAPIPVPLPEPVEGGCGGCNRCVEACPTGALEKPFLLNVPRCLAYLTVEYAGDLPTGAGRKMGNCFYGCDRCQEACPFNPPEEEVDPSLPSSDEILEMTDVEFNVRLGKTALARGGLQRVKRNILAIRKEGSRK